MPYKIKTAKTRKSSALKEVYLDVTYTLAPEWVEETIDYDEPSGWHFLDRWPDPGFKMTDMFMGKKSALPKMRKYLESYFADLKKRGVVTRFAIRTPKPKP
jgi:hypothetical protein